MVYYSQYVVRRGMTPYSNRVVLVKRSDNLYRFTLDLRRINQYCHLRTEPTNPMIDILTKLRGKNTFVLSDLSASYFQIRLHPSSYKYFGFEIPRLGGFYLTRCPMGYIA